MIDSLVKFLWFNIILSCFLLLSASQTNAQDEYKDTLRVEEVKKSDSVVNKQKFHNPGKAVLYSALIPGLGQAYNKKYWKIPLIYGGGAALYTFFEFNQYHYIRFRRSYTEYYETEEVSDPEIAGAIENREREDALAFLKVYRDNYYRDAARGIIFIGLLYFANIIDAMVDAYLFSYDVSDNLTLKIEPDIKPLYNYQFASTNYGLKLSLRF